VALLHPAARWRQALRARADRPPLRPRQPLWWGAERIGSVEPDLFERAGLAGGPLVDRCRRGTDEGWSLDGALSDTLAEIANALRERGLAHVWRDELLAVRGAQGEMLGVVERAAARPLGIATHAVHLAAIDAAGHHWVQQRAFDKATDPGLWDTLVGGMVPACDGLQQALERETWEEAGLHLAQLRDVRWAGRTVTRRPCSELPHGYIIETLDWYVATLPAGVLPRNQDGEVAQFCAMPPGEVTQRLEAGEFTVDASVILLEAFGRSVPE
jgi:8-oxo-dGTP pyrophosphatase MutT (NUDIX family)